MAKYAVHTKWSWPDGVPSAESMQQRHREVKSKTKAEDIIWFKIDEIPISQLLFILLRQMLRKRMLSDRQCAKTQLQKQATLWSKRLWVKFSQLCLKYSVYA